MGCSVRLAVNMRRARQNPKENLPESAGLKSASSGVRLASQGPKKLPNALKFNLIVSTDCEPTSALRASQSEFPERYVVHHA
jgi:hypothetical protein